MLPCTKSWEFLLEHNLELGYRNQKGNLLSSKRFGHPALNVSMVLLHIKDRERALLPLKPYLAIGFVEEYAFL